MYVQTRGHKSRAQKKDLDHRNCSTWHHQKSEEQQERSSANCAVAPVEKLLEKLLQNLLETSLETRFETRLEPRLMMRLYAFLELREGFSRSFCKGLIS